MKKKEVIDNLIRGKKADRIGLFDKPWPDTLGKWITQGYPTTDVDSRPKIAFVTNYLPENIYMEGRYPIDPIDHFDFDMDEAGGWFDIMPIVDYSEVVEETDEWVSKRNGAGAVLKWWKRRSGTPEHVDFKMTSREIWEKDYRPHLLKVDKSRFIATDWTKNEMAKRKDNWHFYGHLGQWEAMRSSLGDICMFETLSLDPGWVHDFNRVYTDFFKEHYKLYFEIAGKPDGIWIYEDLAYARQLFCSPKMLEKLFFPYYKELVDFFHSFDLPVVFHCCGHMEEILPLVVDAGFEGLNPMQVSAGCDVVRFAKKYGEKLAFIGGLSSRILEAGNKELIKKEILRIIEGVKEVGGRLIFGSDHSLSTNVPYEAYKYAIEVYKENMYYS